MSLLFEKEYAKNVSYMLLICFHLIIIQVDGTVQIKPVFRFGLQTPVLYIHEILPFDMGVASHPYPFLKLHFFYLFFFTLKIYQNLSYIK